MTKQALLEKITFDLRMSVSSKRLIDVVSNLAVNNPYNNKIIKLKTRPGYENVPIEEYELFDEKREMDNNYQDLMRKNILVDNSLLYKYRSDNAFKLHAEQV